jgi:uncharacterized protein YraI
MNLRARILSVVLLLSIMLMPFAGVALAEGAQQVQFVAPRLVVNTSFLNVRTGPGVQYTTLITVVGGTELPVLGVANDGVWFQVSTVIGIGWVNVEFTLPRGNFENIPVVDVSPAGVPVVVNAPTSLGLPGQGGGGVVVVGQGGGQAITTTTTTTAPTSTGGLIRVQLENGETVTVASGERFRVAIVTGDPVNLRTQPSITAPPVGIIYPDVARDYAIVGRSVDRGGLEWLAIDVPGIGSGWIEAPKALLRLSGAFRDVVFANQDAAVFAMPGSTGNINMPIVPRGQEGFIAGFSQDSVFVLLELGGGDRVWVPFDSVTGRTGTTTDELDLAASQLVPVAVPSTTTTTTTSAPQTSFVAGSFGLDTPHLVINTSSLNIRSGPGAQYTSLAVVPGGTELPVLGLASDGVWFLVAGPFGQGWVYSEFALFRGAIQNVPIIPLSNVSGVLASPTAVVSAAVTLYAAPGTNFGAIGTLSGPIEVPVVARTADFAWVQLNTSLGFGWVPASQVAIRGDATLIPIVG